MAIARILDWVTCGWKPTVCGNAANPRPPLWQRPDLIEPPLRPLPPSRPRRLTGTPDTYPQQQSSLIARLPAEIRTLIWEYALGPDSDQDVLHIELADGTLRHNRCYERDSEFFAFQHNCWSAAWRMSFRKGGAKGRREPKGKERYRAMLPLLLTCKLMFVLAHSILSSLDSDERQLHRNRRPSLLHQYLRLPPNGQRDKTTRCNASSSPPADSACPIQHRIRLLRSG